jgi:hypothetical protein
LAMARTISVCSCAVFRSSCKHKLRTGSAYGL